MDGTTRPGAGDRDGLAQSWTRPEGGRPADRRGTANGQWRTSCGVNR